MRVWNFTEMSYHPVWDQTKDELRVTLPNKMFDPAVGNNLFNQYLDQHLVADEEGLDIMVNEHHASATCLCASAPLMLGALARQTRKARLLVLGNPVGNRPDPIRVAEELAMIDVISGGRLETGFVRALPAEIAPANSNPATLTERYWEAYELIKKAWTSHEGPFSWEGNHFHYRQVNIWPRPLQQPTPPIWFASATPEYGIIAADHDATIASFFGGPHKTRDLYNVYRKRRSELGMPRTGTDKFAYLAIIAVGHTQEQGIQRVHKIMDYLKTLGRTGRQFANPPGFLPTQANVRALKQPPSGPFAFTARNGRVIPTSSATLEDLSDAGMVFAGDPDSVYRQIADFNAFLGGCGNLLMMSQGGSLEHDEALDSIRLFAREVLPRLRETPSLAAIDAEVA